MCPGGLGGGRVARGSGVKVWLRLVGLFETFAWVRWCLGVVEREKGIGGEWIGISFLGVERARVGGGGRRCVGDGG